MRTRRNAGRADEAEMARRADIVRRYVETDLPSGEDDRRFAEELGLSIDSLFRLAAAWRKHGEARFLQGGRPAPGVSDREAARTLRPDHVDFSAVDPGRLEETRRRIAVIHRFLQIARPTAEDRAAAAAEFGVVPARFGRIVRAWTMHRDPKVIPGARVQRGKWRRDKYRRQRVRELLGEILAALGPKATVVAVHARLEEACRAEDLKPPALTTLYDWMREASAPKPG